MNSDNGYQRPWFDVDKINALGAADGLKDAQVRLWNFGGRSSIEFQSIAPRGGPRRSGGPNDPPKLRQLVDSMLLLKHSWWRRSVELLRKIS